LGESGKMKSNKIVIVGGGSAGWMTAAMLVKTFPEKDITVIESPDIPKVGVGESTLDGLQYYIKYLEIDKKDFFKYTNASIKLGIEFINFYKDFGEDPFFYIFGIPEKNNTLWGLQDWLIKKYVYKDTPVTEYSESYFPATFLAKYGKFSENLNNEFDGFDPELHTSFHFDANLFGEWLKNNYAIPKGVKSIIGDVVDVNVKNKFVKSIILKDKKEIFADLFIDCTGFQSLILGKALEEPFVSYHHRLPNNNAWATQINYVEKEKELKSVTSCTALKNGWAWNIPLWSRIGAGYVYSDQFISDEEALKEFKEYLLNNKNFIRSPEQINSLEYKKIKIKSGIYERTWVNNVVAIGLSAGFIEPLESTGLYTVHEFLFQLVKFLLRDEFGQWEIDSYNHETRTMFDGLCQFVEMHYFLSQRRDSKYWKNITSKPHDLKKYNDFTDGSHILLNFKNEKSKTGKPFDVGGTAWISAGMEYFVLDEITISLGQMRNKMNYKEDLDIYFKMLDEKRNKWKKNAIDSPTMYRYLLKKYYEN
jgi:flavin-dependent dehydrogenase